jgi:hypothetical protein
MRTNKLLNLAAVFGVAAVLAACPDRQEPAPPPATTPPPTTAPPATAPLPGDTPGGMVDTLPGGMGAPGTPGTTGAPGTGAGTGTTPPPP